MTVELRVGQIAAMTLGSVTAMIFGPHEKEGPAVAEAGEEGEQFTLLRLGMMAFEQQVRPMLAQCFFGAPEHLQFVPFHVALDEMYRTVAVVASDPDGSATLQMVPQRSGRWRAQVLQPWGRWKSSRSDYLKVRRAR